VKQVYRLTTLILAMVVFLSSNAECGEEEVLQALDAVKTNVESGVSPDTLGRLLDEAKVQIDILEQEDLADDCFRQAVANCYYWYTLARRNRETVIANQVQRDKYDQKAMFGDVRMRPTYEKIVANYEELIKHAYEALPSKWDYGNAGLQVARECLADKQD
jgi:hypothetical protein